MALIFMLVAKKVKLLGHSQLHNFTATSIMVSLIWPFCLKVVLNLRPIKEIVESMAHDSSLFVFQFGRVLTSPAIVRRRWDRVVRLAQQRIVTARESVALTNHDDAFHSLSMVAL